MPLDGKLSGQLTLVGGAISGALSGAQSLSGTLSGGVGSAPTYEGEYRFTPTNAVQVIDIGGQKAAQDIVIEAIPSNYGLITWNGSILTVS